MQYRVGQTVRSLHESGEGVITALLDSQTVEVDFGDDFPIDVDIRDLIPIDKMEHKYLGGAPSALSGESSADPDVRKPLTMGVELLEVSLVCTEKEGDTVELIMANPEPSEILYTVYRRDQSKYYGLASGQLESGAVKSIALLTGSELERTRSFYVQVLNFIPGKGHPHSPMTSDLTWNKGILRVPGRFLEAVGETAWVFPLRKNLEKNTYESLPESDFIRVAREDRSQQEITMEVDLHLEELVPFSEGVPPSEALSIQMGAVSKALSDALVNHASSLILIHGVGAGTLRQEVHALLKRTRHVKSFSSADNQKYGQGATKVLFR